MKLSLKKIFATGFVALLAMSSVNCGSSATTTEETAGTTEDAATTIAQTSLSLATSSASLASPSFSAALTKAGLGQSIFEAADGSIACSSGTLVYAYDTDAGTFSFTATNCDFGDGSGTMNGTFTITDAGDSVTMTYTDFTVDVDGSSFSMDGSMALSISGDDVTITYSSLTASDGTYSFSIDGSLIYDTVAGLLTGDITIDDTEAAVSVTCTFDSFNLAEATSSEWDAACVLN